MGPLKDILLIVMKVEGADRDARLAVRSALRDIAVPYDAFYQQAEK